MGKAEREKNVIAATGIVIVVIFREDISLMESLILRRISTNLQPGTFGVLI
jgi:hypothetical protein